MSMKEKFHSNVICVVIALVEKMPVKGTLKLFMSTKKLFSVTFVMKNLVENITWKDIFHLFLRVLYKPQEGPSINDIRFQGWGVGFQKSESPYVKKPLVQEENRRWGERGSKMTQKIGYHLWTAPNTNCLKFDILQLPRPLRQKEMQHLV